MIKEPSSGISKTKQVTLQKPEPGPWATTCARMALLLLSLFLFSCKTYTQEAPLNDSLASNYRLLFELQLEATQFTTDKLQNIYFISTKNEVVKLKPDGTEQFRFIDKTLGIPTYIDATNPFNLLLFYPDYQNVLTLDRTMNLAGQFNLYDLGLFGVNAVGMASDNNLWLYDVVNFRLKKMGQDGRVVVQSADLSLELNRAIRPNFLVERDQQVYLNDPEKGILVFDVFGKYLKTLPITGLSGFQVFNNELLFFRDGRLHSFHLMNLLQKPVLLPVSITGKDQWRVVKDRFYILKKDKLQVFGF